jgi:5-methylcytosine-specific restriction endonuclease McrA
MKADYYQRRGEFIRARVQQWRKNNPDKKNAIARAWRAKPEVVIKHAERREQRKDEINAKQRASYRLNPTIWKFHSRKRYLEKPDKVREEIKRWRAANIDKVRLNAINGQARRKARKAGGRVTKTDLAEIMQRDKMQCYLCGFSVSRNDLSFDHVIPLVAGGSHSSSNLRVSHLRCNIKKGTKIITITPGFGGIDMPAKEAPELCG